MNKIRVLCWQCKQETQVFSMFDKLPKNSMIQCAPCAAGRVPSGKFAAMMRRQNARRSSARVVG